MKSGAPASPDAPKAPVPGEQFPPLPAEGALATGGADNGKGDAMARLADRANVVVANEYQAEGFEASVHKIKEQVLPRLLERVDPEAAATLSKDELSE